MTSYLTSNDILFPYLENCLNKKIDEKEYDFRQYWLTQGALIIAKPFRSGKTTALKEFGKTLKSIHPKDKIFFFYWSKWLTGDYNSISYPDLKIRAALFTASEHLQDVDPENTHILIDDFFDIFMNERNKFLEISSYKWKSMTAVGTVVTPLEIVRPII